VKLKDGLWLAPKAEEEEQKEQFADGTEIDYNELSREIMEIKEAKPEVFATLRDKVKEMVLEEVAERERGEELTDGDAPAKSANPAAGKTTKQAELDDTLELLHELISEGNLLKEAVRRLQLGLSPKIQRNFYDSDDDCRTPPPAPAHPDLCEIGIN